MGSFWSLQSRKYSNVYISGRRYNSSDDVACYWKVGGSEVEVCDVDSVANAITAVGSDIYTAGNYYDSTDYVACYWKGTAKKDLKPSGSTWSDATGIAVSGGTVYVSVSYGTTSGKEKACYYKDGVKQPDLSKPAGAEDYYAAGIYVK